MATKKQQKAKQRVKTALTTPEWVRFSYDVVDQIIGEVNLPYQTNLVDGKESENEVNVRYRLLMILGERLRRLILRERLKQKLRGFAYDYFHDALSTDPPISDFFLAYPVNAHTHYM